MRILIGWVAVVLSLSVLSAGAFAAGDKKSDKGSGGGPANNQMNKSGDKDQNQSNQSTNSTSDHKDTGSDKKDAGLNFKPDSPGKNSDSKKNADSGTKPDMPNKKKANGENKVDRKSDLGDSGFDKHGIGKMDESKYKDRKDNDWRYKQWGSEWWYWMPGGYWSYWRGNGWHRYDVDAYVDYNNSSGPYYEDQNGFYTMQDGRKVYDPHIHRDN